MSLIKYNDRSIKNLTTTPAAVTGNSPGALVHIKTLTASSSGTLSFVHGSNGVVLDSTYPIYKFEFINIHPSSNGSKFNFNLSVDSGSNYNVSKTSTYINAYHTESDNSSGLSYNTGGDLANGTADQNMFRGVGAANDECIDGNMNLYNPSSTTFVKHFIIRTSVTSSDPGAADTFVAGYGNTTSAVNSVKFLFDTGNIDAGKIKLYGIKDS